MKFKFSYEEKTCGGRKWIDRVIEAESLGDAVREAKKFVNESAKLRGVERVA